MPKKVVYPRPCPTCGVPINNRFNFSRHKKHCGKQTGSVQCMHCSKVFSRKDNLVRHLKTCYSEADKRKAADSAELARMELIHANKVPRLTVEEDQTGGGVTTRGTKRAANKDQNKNKSSKGAKRPRRAENTQPLVDYSDTSDEEEEQDSNPLFVANIAKMGVAKKWIKDRVIDQKFTFTLD